MQKRTITPAINVTAHEFNQGLRKYNQPTIDFARILLPSETIDKWMQEFKVANQRGYLLHDTKKGMRTNDYELWYGSSKQAVFNQNIINIYEALRAGSEPKIINPSSFQNALLCRVKILDEVSSGKISFKNSEYGGSIEKIS